MLLSPNQYMIALPQPHERVTISTLGYVHGKVVENEFKYQRPKSRTKQRVSVMD